MANNPYVNKVVFGSATLVDLTGTTATADKIMQGYGAFGADGAWMDGTASGGDQHGTIWQDGQGYVHLDDESGIALQSKSVTPSESQQIVEADDGYYALDTVTVGAISSSYVGSGVSRRSSSDLTASGATVTAPAGYYSASASKSVASGSVVPSIEYSGDDISVWVDNTGLVHVEGGYSATVNPVSASGWINSSASTEVEIALQNTYQLSTQAAKTVTPTTSSQTAVTAGKYTTGAVTVAAMPTGTAGTPTATKGTVSNHAVTVTPSVTNTTGYISGGTKTGTGVSVSASELVSGTYSVNSSGTKDVTNYASISVPAGTEGTPTATKGTVSNHSVSVTPSVTNTAGYIGGSTKTGTAVTVSASELVSGTKSITENGTGIDVTNYASVDVDVVSTGGPFAATITRTGIKDNNIPMYCFVRYNGNDYYTKGDTFVFNAGDTLRIFIQTYSSGQRIIKENGVVIVSETGKNYWYYDYTLPAYDVDIQLYQIFTTTVGSVNISKSESNYKLIASTTYQVNTTSTTSINVGTFSTGDTSIWTSDKMVYVKIRHHNGRQNGYYFGSDCIFSINAPGNNLTATESYLMYGTSYYQNSAGNLINYNLQRVTESAAVQGYGVYATKVHSNGDIEIYARYSSAYTLTINGTFYVDVYLLDWPGGIGPFNE